MMIMAQAVIIGLKNMSKKQAKKGRRGMFGEEGRAGGLQHTSARETDWPSICFKQSQWRFAKTVVP